MSNSFRQSTWIYHERQEALLCGQHALNNLLQLQSFSPVDLASVAHELDEMELSFMSTNNEGGIHSRDFIMRVAEGSGNVDESGNFSIEVLRAALLNRYKLSLANVKHESVRDMEITEFDGFICNKDSHWFAVRKIHGRFWNLNSTLERPELITHFCLATEFLNLQERGYSVFCVVEIGKLPEPCSNDEEKAARGLPEFWWNESDLIHRKEKKTDPWINIGSGNRLDGKFACAVNNQATNALCISGLTDDEMLQMAMEASQHEAKSTFQPNVKHEPDLRNQLDLGVEPSLSDEGVVRIRFRLPDTRVVMRRFFKTDLVDLLYTFVHQSCPVHDKRVEMRAGYPLKDIKDFFGKTIEVSNLAGELVHCRHI